jgi:hypothetical protein
MCAAVRVGWEWLRAVLRLCLLLGQA